MHRAVKRYADNSKSALLRDEACAAEPLAAVSCKICKSKKKIKPSIAVQARSGKIINGPGFWVPAPALPHLQKQLCDLYGIERGALAQVVADNPHR